MDLQKLEHHIEINNLGSAIKLIQEIVDKDNSEAITILIKHLKDTDNHDLRNKIVLALSDLSCEEAVTPIIELLNSPKTNGNRDTLSYALKPLDYSNHIELLLNQMINGNYEAQQESKQLILGIKDKLQDEVLQKDIN